MKKQYRSSGDVLQRYVTALEFVFHGLCTAGLQALSNYPLSGEHLGWLEGDVMSWKKTPVTCLLFHADVGRTGESSPIPRKIFGKTVDWTIASGGTF